MSADVIDEIWTMLAELHDKVDALGAMLAKRDKVNVELVKHTERLVREKEDLLKYIGIADLVRRANAGPPRYAHHADCPAAHGALACTCGALAAVQVVPTLSAPGQAAQPRLADLAERISRLKGA